MEEHELASASYESQISIDLESVCTAHFNIGEYHTISYFLLSVRLLVLPYTFIKPMHNAMHGTQIDHLRKYHSPAPTNTAALTNVPALFKIRLF